MDEEPKKKWYHTTVAVLIVLATLGPFGLPVVWNNPNYSRFTKIWITVVVIVVTVLLCYLAYRLILLLINCFRELTTI